MTAVLIAGLGSVAAPHAVADAARMAGSPGSSAGPGTPVTAYVANYGSGMVTPIATATNIAGPPIPGGRGPSKVRDHPGRQDRLRHQRPLGPPIPVGSAPYAVAITPDGKTAYVTNALSDTVTPIATATNTAGPPIPVGSAPYAVAITPDGKTAYVANIDSGSVIATATNTAGPPIPTGRGSIAIAITPRRQDRLRRQLLLGHGDPDRDRHQHHRAADRGWRRSPGHRDHTPTARPATSPTPAQGR